MASRDNPRQPLTSGTTPVVKYTEMSNSAASPSTMITMTNIRSSITGLSNSNDISKFKKQDSVAISESELRRMPTHQRRVVKKTLMANVGYRLGKRKQLHIQRRMIGDIMFFLGVLGIILMIIENELSFNGVGHKDTTFSLLLKSTITFTTILLVGLVFCYHRVDIGLYCIDNSIDDWRIVLTRKKVFMVLLEAIICIIHPIPGHFLVEWSSQYVRNNQATVNFFNPYQTTQSVLDNRTIITATTTTAGLPVSTTLTLPNSTLPQSFVPIDVMLSIPMFFRLYLVCRFIMLNSHLVRDASSQSLGYLNRVSFNFQFVLKSYIQRRPALCLTTFCITMFFIASWSMRACDYNVQTGHMSFLDSTWLFIISFTTIGYGDIVPSTYCGRTIAAITGVIGVFSTALLVAVISQKLELTRSEKYVHSFVGNIQLAKAHKDQAANIVKYGWKVWYLRRRGKHLLIQYIDAQRKLLKAIHLVRKIKQEQRKLADNHVSLLELFTVQRSTNLTTDDISQRVVFMERKVDKLEDKLIEINHGVCNLQDKLDLLLNRISRS